MAVNLVDDAAGGIPLNLIRADDWQAWISNRPETERAWAAANGFEAKPVSYTHLTLPTRS